MKQRDSLLPANRVEVLVATKIETIAGDSRGSGKLVVELVLGHDLVIPASPEDGEGTVASGEEDSTIGCHGGTSVGLAMEAFLVELLARLGVKTEDSTVLLAKVE